MKIYKLNPFVRWWNILNKWEFPPELSFLKPRGFDDLPNFRHDKTLPQKWTNKTFRLCIKICIRFSTQQQRLNYHYVVGIRRTQEQFDKWWTDEKAIFDEKTT
jgi:hypothetical protein